MFSAAGGLFPPNQPIGPARRARSSWLLDRSSVRAAMTSPPTPLSADCKMILQTSSASTLLCSSDRSFLRASNMPGMLFVHSLTKDAVTVGAKADSSAVAHRKQAEVYLTDFGEHVQHLVAPRCRFLCGDGSYPRHPSLPQRGPQGLRAIADRSRLQPEQCYPRGVGRRKGACAMVLSVGNSIECVC
eukprot:scaffold1054_cov333-Pavlova_lutheri.AAC.4